MGAASQEGDEHEIIPCSFRGLKHVKRDYAPEISLWPIVRRNLIRGAARADSVPPEIAIGARPP